MSKAGSPFERYDRQIPLPEIGPDGQKRLSESSVLVIGAGGLGSPVSMYLAAAGVGDITVADCDDVSKSNLNRQILYTDADIGEAKAPLAEKRLRALNGDIRVRSLSVKIDGQNAASVISGFDALVLCLDRIGMRKTVNRAAVRLRIPYVDGAVSAFYGSVTTVIPFETACYECGYQHVTREPSSFPVIGAVAGVTGCMMALAALRLLLKQPDPSAGAFVCFDGKRLSVEHIPVSRRSDCPVCGTP